MIVVDASVLVNAMIDDGDDGARAWEILADEEDWSSARHLHAEVYSGLRGCFLGQHITQTRAESALAYLSGISVFLVDTSLLLSRMWELRDNLTGYDAAYVAAAETLGCPLITADARLAGAPGIRCEVRLAA